MKTPLSISVLLVLALPDDSTAQSWARFRGPAGQGIAIGARPPTQFTEETIRWRVTDLGRGNSSPVLWGDRLFLTRPVSRETIELLCLDAVDGQRQWSMPIDIERYRINQINSLAGATPTVDGDAVYIVWQSGSKMFAAAVDHAGEEIWRTSIGSFVGEQGSCTSPVLLGDVLVVAKEGEEGTGAVLALDRRTGEEIWQLQRAAKQNGTCYASPIVYRPAVDADPVLVLTNIASGVVGVDPRDGSERWRLESAFPTRCIGTPALSGNRLMYTAGARTTQKEAEVLELPIDSTGEPRRLFTLRRNAPYVASPIAVSERFFVFTDAGVASCVDAESGEELWRERIGERFFSSPVSDGRHLFVIDHAGTLFCLAAGGEFELIGKYELDEEVIATPAIVGDSLYVRTAEQLICLRTPGRRMP